MQLNECSLAAAMITLLPEETTGGAAHISIRFILFATISHRNGESGRC